MVWWCWGWTKIGWFPNIMTANEFTADQTLIWVCCCAAHYYFTILYSSTGKGGYHNGHLILSLRLDCCNSHDSPNGAPMTLMYRCGQLWYDDKWVFWVEIDKAWSTSKAFCTYVFFVIRHPACGLHILDHVYKSTLLEACIVVCLLPWFLCQKI